MKIHINQRIMLIITMGVFGTIGVFVRYIPVSSGELALYRAILATLLIGAYLIITRQKLPLSHVKREAGVLFLSGAAMGCNWIFLFEAYRHTTVSMATISYYFAPVIVTVVCPVIFKEKLTRKQIICSIMATCGLILITGIGDLSGGGLLGIFFGLIAAMLYATVIILNKYIKNVNGIYRTFVQFIAAIVVLVPYVLATSKVTVLNINKAGLVCLLIVGFIHTGVAYCMYFSSIKELPGQKVAIISYIDPLVAVVLSVVFLGEAMSWYQVLGGILILGFTLISEMELWDEI